MADDQPKTNSYSAHGCSRVDDSPESAGLNDAAATPFIEERPPGARVAILLCSCNGQAYLASQLDSIARQRWPAWFVVLFDDGSLDRTLDIAAFYQTLWGEHRLNIRRGPCQGFARNFLSSLRSPQWQAEFYAWCDQDDVWHPDKLTHAVGRLQQVPPGTPALYMGRTCLINAQGDTIGHSPLFRRPAGFANALVQSMGGGNTMVFNHAARCVLNEASERLEAQSLEVVSHDWWAYLLICGVGGHVFYDPVPYVFYRQHERNLVGSNRGWCARWLRLRQLLQGRFRRWNSLHIAALKAVSGLLTERNRELLVQFGQLRSRSLVGRLTGLRRARLYRQTLAGNLGLLVAAMFDVL